MKKLFLLPVVAMFALVGCGNNGGNGGGGAKSWKKVTSAPVAGTGYRLALNRAAAADGDNTENPGLWYLTGQTGKEAAVEGSAQDYYLATDADVTKGADVEVKVVDGGYTLKVGTRYLFIGEVASGSKTYTNSLFKEAEADATVLTWDATNGFGVTLSEKFWGLGTRNDKGYTTVGAVNFTQYQANYKVALYQYK